MKILIRNGEIIPPWHRVAYFDFVRNEGICYPIGLHYVVRIARRIWECSLRYNPSKLELMMQQKYQDGMKEEFNKMVSIITRSMKQNGK